MKTYFAFKMNIGQCKIYASEKWGRFLRLFPWIALLFSQSLSMIIVASSGMPAKLGLMSLYVAVGLGSVSTYIVCCAFFSWHSMTNLGSSHKESELGVTQAGIITWRYLEITLIIITLGAYLIGKFNS